MAGGTLDEAIGGEMKIAKINVGENAETELNDALMSTKTQKVSMTATKNNANGVVYDSLPPTNDAALDCLDCPAREECTFGKTGMCTKKYCWFFFVKLEKHYTNIETDNHLI